MNTIRGDISATLLLTWDAADRTEGVVNLAALEDDPVPFAITTIDRDDIACLVFSSGTTGTPKGAVNSYWNVLAKTVSLILEPGADRQRCRAAGNAALHGRHMSGEH